MPFHVELKDGREAVRAFNLTEEEVRRRFIEPLAGGVIFMLQDKEFEPRRARLTVIEGRRLGPGQLGLGGVGWASAVKGGTDVTRRFLEPLSAGRPGVEAGTGTGSPAGAASAGARPGGDELTGRLRERLLGRLTAGPLPLSESLALSGDLLAGHRVSERLAATETVIWELLHAGSVGLAARPGGQPVASEGWAELLLDPATWLASGPEAPEISATA